MSLNARDLAPYLRSKEDRQVQYYAQILQKVLSRIKAVAKLGQTHCLYEIPWFVPGLPIFDARACTAYVIVALRKQDFQVQFMCTGHLWISWAHVTAPSKPLPALPVPSMDSKVKALDLDPSTDAVQNLRKVYDEASVDVLTRLAPPRAPGKL